MIKNQVVSDRDKMIVYHNRAACEQFHSEMKTNMGIENLQNGKLWGAALDVFEHEPHISDALKQLDNVVMSPHIGTGTIDGRLAMCRCVADNILHFAAGDIDKMNVVK